MPLAGIGSTAGTTDGWRSSMKRPSTSRISTERDPSAKLTGLPPGECAFLPCTFWLVDNLALQGRMDEAEALFERLLALRSDLGLLAEEWDPETRRQLGNFPQAFTHVALVNTAFNLNRQEQASPMEQRSPYEEPAGY